MNTKGFTLTELIVTIALIGIISMIAFPAISQLKENNKLEKYKAYEKVMKTGAKLYVDSKKADLFIGKNIEKISYSTLLDNKLKIVYKDDELAGKSIETNGTCEYDPKNNHFGKNSYECFYQWNKSKIPNIKNQLKQEADNNNGEVTMGKAC